MSPSPSIERRSRSRSPIATPCFASAVSSSSTVSSKRLEQEDRRQSRRQVAAASAETADSAVTIVDDPAEVLAALADRLRAAPLVALDTETSSLEPHDAELIGLSFAIVRPRRSGTSPSGIGRPAGSSPLRPPVRTLPPITDARCAPIAALLARSRGPQGRPQHQVRLAGAATRRRRAAGGRLRLDAGQLRARSGPALARHRHPERRAPRPADAAVHRSHRQGQGADPLRRGAGGGSGRLLRGRQRDRARTARLLRAVVARHGARAPAGRRSRCRWSRCWSTWSGTASRSIVPLRAARGRAHPGPGAARGEDRRGGRRLDST